MPFVRSFVLSSLIFGFVAVTQPVNAAEREWTDNTGKFTIRAELLEIRPISVVLILPNGTTREVPLMRLSANDRRYVSNVDQEKLHSRRAPASVLVAKTGYTSSVEFYRELFVEDALGQPEIAKFIRLCSRIIPDSYKPVWAFPLATVVGILIVIFGSLWLLVRSFKSAVWKGVVLILINVISSIFPLLELLRWCFLVYLLFSDWSYFKAPFFLHFLGWAVFVSGFFLVIEALIPAV